MILPSFEQFPHALVITGNRQANLQLVKSFLEENAVQVVGNSDVFIFDQESLKIDELRDHIISFLSNQKVSKQRFVIISVDQFGPEAQNAFLKKLEEPEEGTHIIILISDEKKLPSTILSRAQIVYGEQQAGDSRLDVEEFIKMKLADKFEYVETWTKNKKDEDNVSKSEVINFIDQLEK
jgi:DNA polymerase III delta prime subunit